MNHSRDVRHGLVSSWLRRWLAPARRILRKLPAAQPAAEPLEGRQLMAASVLPRPAHIVVVMEENHSFSEIIGSSAAPYLNSLAQSGALFTNAHGETHPSQANYINLFSGGNQGVTGDEPLTRPFTTPNLGAQLLHAKHTFAGYSEGLPNVGSTVNSAGLYVRRHNPWVDWQGAGTNGLPASVNRPFTSFPKNNFAALPTVSFVVPNLNDDMHNGTVAQADSWLKANIGPYVNWAKTHNSLLIVTWDEGDEQISGPENNHIPTLFVGPMVKPGQYSEAINHINVLRTVEAMYGLPPIGAARSLNPITDVFK